ncbi:efflux RND transporter periplasmic adaptor subunit [Oscillibacter sp.]|uniref:efflux RND transporter periplasmic adaptor subunit n=1 Tax=Oscillibacter sp. TaxID=1945593 RepID=UPI00289915E3|nr:efflux RND transporter periplasmic adaptor subunit [Oscillibacter sp.]
MNQKWKQCILSVVCGGVFAMTLTGCGAAATEEVMDPAITVETQTVSVGALATRESYVATVSADESVTVYPKVSGVVTNVNVFAGDTVQAGQVLCRFDGSENARISQQQAQLNYQQIAKTRYPSSTTAGRVQAVYITDGDSVSTGTEIAQIVSDDSLYADYWFVSVAAQTFYIGQSAKIYINGLAGTSSGTITAISAASVQNDINNDVQKVRIKLDNSGYVTAGQSSQAEVNGVASYNWSTIQFNNVETVCAVSSGIVSGCTIMEGDSVSAGQTLCTISSDAIDSQLASSQLALASSGIALENYTLTSPISGVLEEVNITENNIAGPTSPAFVISASGSKTAFFYVTDNVSKTLTQGQGITVTDQGSTYEGEISEIGLAVDSSTGLFKVKASLLNALNLSNGLTVTLTTDAREQTDGIVIPTDALYFENGNAYVFLVQDDHAVRTDVTVGLYTADKVTITGGLSSGYEIITTWSAGLKDGVPIRRAATTSVTELLNNAGAADSSTGQ